MQIKPPKKLFKKLKQLKGLKKKSVIVGFPKGWNNYSDGTSVAMVATVHEFGSAVRNIPPRPYFRPTLHEHNFYKRLRKMTFTKMMRGEIMQKQAMGKIGDTVANDIKDAIVAVRSPALKDATIKQKGGKSNPLVNSQHLVHSVTYKVVK